MSRDTIDNLEELAKNLEHRKPVFVDDKGQIHDAEKVQQLAREDDDKPMTQIKPTTWFC